MRSPLPRAVLTRLETGRLVVLSVLLGGLVGALCVGLRLLLGRVLELGAWLTGFSPPGTPGEGGLLMAFGEALPWGLLALAPIGAAYVWLIPREDGDPLNQLVRGAHTRGDTPTFPTQLRTLAATLLGYGAGLLVGRDAPYTVLGGLGARLLGRATRLDAVETRSLTLAGAAAGLGAVLHAPLAAAVLVAEVLYRRFEFEFEVLMPCVLASVAAYAVYGLAFGFLPLLSVPEVGVPTLAGVGPLVGVALAVTLAGWAALLVCRIFPDAWTRGSRRVALGGTFGLLTAAIAWWGTPGVLGDGSGWAQVGLSGFLGEGALGEGAWRWGLLALGARLAFGGGVLPSVGVGGLLGVGLGSVWGADPGLAALVGIVAFVTVTLNAPLAAALLVVAWGGDALLPAALVTAGLAHVLSGETGLLPAQVRSRAQSPAPLPVLPGTGGVTIRRAPAAAAPLLPLHAAPPGDTETGLAPLESEQELYRRPVPRSWAGARLSVLSLPPGVEVVGVVRGGAVQVPRPQMRLTADDELVFLARPDAYAALEGVLRLPGV